MPPFPKGETPLHYFALHMDDERLLELLLALGCPLDLADERGFTPRERLRQRGREDLAERLAPAAAPLAGSFLHLEEGLEDMKLQEAAQQCRGYLHKYPTSGAVRA